ncbi:MAG: VanZ family protein [Bacteroidales bacterium]|nr:VanZ family protein [Bacteroidales bacterium]
MSFTISPSYEIPLSVVLIAFAVMALVLVAGLSSSRVANKKKFVLWALLVEYLFLVVCAAVVCRPLLPKHLLHLKPLWVYTDFLNSKHTEAVRDIIINLLLFLPVGALLAGISPSLKWYWVLLIGVACSLSIEVLQYIFLRGVAQTDDLIHNAVSCIAGWGLTKMLVGTFEKE